MPSREMVAQEVSKLNSLEREYLGWYSEYMSEADFNKNYAHKCTKEECDAIIARIQICKIKSYIDKRSENGNRHK